MYLKFFNIKKVLNLKGLKNEENEIVFCEYRERHDRKIEISIRTDFEGKRLE